MSDPGGESARARGRETASAQAGEERGCDPREESLRIGDVARLVGTTPRTIRYYEEIGLLPTRPSGRPASTVSTRPTRWSACRR